MRYLTTILAILILQSCIPDCKNIYFTENDKMWFTNYNIGDKIIFKSQMGDFDTILITNKILDKPKGNCPLFASGGFDREFARIDYQIKKDTFKLIEDYFVQISANDKLEDASPVIRLFNMEFSTFNNELPTQKYSKINSDWKNVYTFNESNCPHHDLKGKFGIIEFEWDKEIGLVSYSNEDGEKWIFHRKE